MEKMTSIAIKQRESERHTGKKEEGKFHLDCWDGLYDFSKSNVKLQKDRIEQKKHLINFINVSDMLMLQEVERHSIL